MAHAHSIYSWGYQGQRFADLQTFVKHTGAVVVDVRLKPFSRDPVWRRAALERALGEQYRWVEALGNLNYRSGGPVRLKDEASGLAVVRGLALQAPVILMCACRSQTTCHRTMVARLLGTNEAILGPPSLEGAELTSSSEQHTQ